MIVLEAPYVSEVMSTWLAETHAPVLANEFARSLAASGLDLNLVEGEDAVERLGGGERVYTCSENALAWVLENADDEALCRNITLCKDKAATRRALAGIDSVFFEECTMGELEAIDPSELTYPLVVKPAVGFISFGVHVVSDAAHWGETAQTLKDEIADGSVFPESVIGGEKFIIEGFITGQEYAVDVYFDEAGEPVILDVMQHDFLDAEDTSDHYYFTSLRLMREAAPLLAAWFREANRELGFTSFCTHVELRVTYGEGESPLEAMGDGKNIHVIEFNPLRFAGVCGTDLGYFAYGIRTYEWYLENKRPDWEALAEADSDEVTAFIVLDKPAGWTAGASLDLEAFERDLLACGDSVEVCALRPMDPDVQGISCFPIFKMRAGEDEARARMFALTINADKYMRLAR